MIKDLDAFIARHRTEVALDDGTRIRIRPIRPDDKEALARAAERASPETRYRRFMGPVDKLSDAQLRYLTEVDYVDHFAWVALNLDEEGAPGVGVARYVRDKDDPSAAEAAVAVVDDHHGRGLGTLLLEALALQAAENGIKRFRGVALASNEQIHELLRHVGAQVSPPSKGEVTFELELPGRMDDLRKTPLYRAMRQAARAVQPLFRHPRRHS